jgi:hypothetical protein
MRDLGYSLETAIADVIDNSISADASEISIYYLQTSDNPVLSIIDNGYGMNPEEILSAMRHGATSPKEIRSLSDLGRFGLGLKTASFSQCRRLTVVSKKNGVLSGAEWDLDLVDRKDDWIISVLDENEIATQPFVDRLTESGTVVIWRELDRLFEEESGHTRDEIVNEKLDVVIKHLALVFHRYLSGEIKGRRRLSISVNGHPVKPFDPFCRNNTTTQCLPQEIIRINDSKILIQPWILPHHSRLTASEYDFYQSRSEFISNQGAYIYRNGRLMAWGDWFRIIPKGEATKLARVQIDFPNTLDDAWTIDIRKSRATPPYPVRERMKQIISQISGRSTRVHKGRGEKLFEEINAPIWERYADHGTIRYSLNTDHPLVISLKKHLNEDGDRSFKVLLDSISTSLPIEMIYSDFSTSPRQMNQISPEISEGIYDQLRILKDILSVNGMPDADTFKEVVRSTRMFDNHMKAVERYITEELS